MGFYVNPPTGTKEDWLAKHGEPLHNPKWPPRPGKAIICLVFNPGFTAAAIIYDEGEFKEFSDPLDPRTMLWYQAPLDDVMEVCPEVLTKL